MYYYQQKNRYLLPTDLYRRMVYTVKDCDRMRSVWTETSSMRCIDVMRPDFGFFREQVSRNIESVERGLNEIPEEYRDGVLRHLQLGVPFPDSADGRTWRKYQSLYIYHVAVNLGEFYPI